MSALEESLLLPWPPLETLHSPPRSDSLSTVTKLLLTEFWNCVKIKTKITEKNLQYLNTAWISMGIKATVWRCKCWHLRNRRQHWWRSKHISNGNNLSTGPWETNSLYHCLNHWHWMTQMSSQRMIQDSDHWPWHPDWDEEPRAVLSGIIRTFRKARTTK